jgi:RNA binding exosome subunit
MIEPEHHNEIILDDNYDNYVIHADYEVEKECNTNPETIYNHFNKDYKYTDIQEILNLENHSDDGKLYAKVKWNNQQETLISAELIRSDDPILLAKHIRDNPVERTRTGFWNTWARDAINDICNTNRKLRRMHRNVSNNDTYYPYSRRTIGRKKKQFPLQMQTYLGIEIPRSVQEAISLDTKNQDNKWNEAMKREINGIQEHGTFEFLPPDSEIPQGYQLAPLRMIFDVMSDL